MRIQRSRHPRGIALWVLQVGFAFIAAIAVFVAVIAARWHSTESQMQAVLIDAARTAVATSYVNESPTQGVQLGQFAQAVDQAAMSELHDTGQVQLACRPIPGVSVTCQSSNNAQWFGIPMSSSVAQHGLVDLGIASSSNSHTMTLAIVLDPPPVLGIQVPLGASQDVQVNLGTTGGVQSLP